ncbi:cytosolic protein [Bacillus lacus]|uniref:Cytosolic protein n=1 Tax=Metabacillus lacus TaxID=1983721 RepID=A0A7X2IY27_9BACI|nr:cytosolic protein [Metabacillus lacus]MRX71774.1 cytosolic protein [Metabacillus lacus]
MSIIQKLQSIFSTHSETSENHPQEELRSRYYKTTAKKAVEVIENVLKDMNGVTVTSVSSERGEISVQVSKPRKAFMIITIISVRPFETAVDFSVTTETPLPFDFGYSKNAILSVYQKIDQSLQYVGSGLNASR